jgi:hypothetical protein
VFIDVDLVAVKYLIRGSTAPRFTPRKAQNMNDWSLKFVPVDTMIVLSGRSIKFGSVLRFRNHLANVASENNSAARHYVLMRSHWRSQSGSASFSDVRTHTRHHMRRDKKVNLTSEASRKNRPCLVTEDSQTRENNGWHTCRIKESYLRQMTHLKAT